MKILLLCNTIGIKIQKSLGMIGNSSAGWIDSVTDILDENKEITLAVCANYQGRDAITKIKWGHDSFFYGFTKRKKYPFEYEEAVENQFREIIREFKPDIVHIFGTEFPHTLSMVRAFSQPDRTVIHIQGLVSIYARYYKGFLSDKEAHKYTFRDFIRMDNIVEQQNKFWMRGKFEREAIRGVSHVMGRTDWDRACTERIHPGIKYHYVQEMMRSPFYEGKNEEDVIWGLKNCEKYSIFMSQGGYPIKGLHLALEALRILKRKYPQVKLYVAGQDLIHKNGVKEKIRESYYSVYIAKKIREYGLEGQIVFTGSLNAEEMKKRYLRSHVFLSASVIENSPNSIGEAMLLGVPIVSSYVGGVGSLIEHEKNGFLYQADAPYMAAYYIGKLFEDGELGEKMSTAEREKAEKLYDREEIMRQLMGVYGEMADSNMG